MPIPYIPSTPTRSPGGAIPYVPGAAASAAPAPAPTPKLGDGAAGEFAGNAVRAVAAPLFRLGGTIESAIGMKKGAASAQGTADRLDAGADKSLAGAAGTVVGVVAPYLTPMGAEEGVAELGAKVAAKTGSKIAGRVAAAAPGFIANAAVGTAQTKSAKEGLLMAGGAEILGAGAKALKGKLIPPKLDPLTKIQELISPKATVKEARSAQAQGRLIKGKKPGIFTAGKPDTVLPSSRTVRASQTIQRAIPDAHAMTEPELHAALDSHVAQVAQRLAPEMAKTPIQPESIVKLNDDWSALKSRQIADAKATDEPNVRKWQANFEKYLQKSGSDNLNDLWETRKSYDASIKDNVKNATEFSPEDLQTQKHIWQQNRAILNDAIHHGTLGLPTDSREAFMSMSDMYDAQQSMLTKAKVETKAEPSKLSKFNDSTGGRFIKGALGGVAGYEGAKKLGVPLP